MDCTDNFETRHLIAKECLVQKIPMSFGSAVRQEGQTAFFLAGCNESIENSEKQLSLVNLTKCQDFEIFENFENFQIFK